MSKCRFCNIFQNNEEQIIYEDNSFFCIFDKSPFTPGHFLLITKEHFHDLFDCPQNLVSKAFVVAKKIAYNINMLENIKGINIYQNNNPSSVTHINHFHLHIVPIQAGIDFEVSMPKNFSDTQIFKTRIEIVESLNKHKKITLSHAPTKEDVISWIEMVNNNIMCEKKTMLMSRNKKIPIEEVDNWYSRIIEKKDLVVIAKNNSGVVAGAHANIQLYKKNHCAKLSLLIDQLYRNQGLGEKILKELTELSRNEGLIRLECEPSVNNISVIKILLNLGYKIEGVLHNKLQTKSNKFSDCLSMYKILSQ